MSSSHFMDKQITGLSSSPGAAGAADFLDLAGPQSDELRRGGSGGGGGGAAKREDILASYDFQPIRAARSSPPTSLDATPSAWGSLDSKTASSNLKYAGILEARDVTKTSQEKERTADDAATVAEIDRTVKKYADNLMHALEGVSSRLSQLESRTHRIENSIDDLKIAVGNNNGSTDGKLRQLENIAREVQTGIQVLRDKQEITEAQFHLAKLQASKGDQQTSENANTGQLDSQQVPPQQSVQQPLQAAAAPTQPPLHAPPAPNAPPQQNQHVVQYPGQLTQGQIPSMNSYFGSPSQSTDTSQQQYQMPSQQPQPTPVQTYQSSPQLPHYSQPPQAPQPVNSSQPQPPLSHHTEGSAPYASTPQAYPPAPQPINNSQQLAPQPHHPEGSAPYAPPPQTYPTSIRQGAPPQQFYGPNPSMYEPPPPTSMPSAGQLSFPGSYGPPSVGPPSFSDPYSYGTGSPSHYSSSTMKPSPFSSSAASSGGGNYHQRLPTAQILPQAQPAGSSGGPTGNNRLPIDDVVDKVSTMGFSRDQVRAAVRKLTENGQSVDLNVVLDKLMNDGEIQPQKGWFGR